MTYDPLDSQADPFKPPAIPVEVSCLHCGQEYESYRIEWRIETDSEGKPHGFWCCPTPGCDGRGFGFDILPTDPEYRDERGGWVWMDDEDEADDEDEDSDEDLADDDEDFVPDELSDAAPPGEDPGSGNGHAKGEDQPPW